MDNDDDDHQIYISYLKCTLLIRYIISNYTYANNTFCLSIETSIQRIF